MTINTELFSKRLIAFYISWITNKSDLWGNSDVIVVYNPPADSPAKLSHQLSSQFYSWLFARDFYDTIVLFSEKKIHFICPKKKVSQLETLISMASESESVGTVFLSIRRR
jgi:nucleosome binding factor SPN SPT16 subunit